MDDGMACGMSDMRDDVDDSTCRRGSPCQMVRREGISDLQRETWTAICQAVFRRVGRRVGETEYGTCTCFRKFWMAGA